MRSNRTLLAGIAALVLGTTSAMAGPCSVSKETKMQDAGAGPTVGNTGQTTTTGSAASQHPPTSAMSKAAGGSAVSSDDVKQQTQGQPTAAQQAQGAKVSEQGC